MVLSMLLCGGATLHYFALALTIGILFGIYSSVFVAAAIAMWLGIKREDLIKAPARKEGDPKTRTPARRCRACPGPAQWQTRSRWSLPSSSMISGPG